MEVKDAIARLTSLKLLKLEKEVWKCTENSFFVNTKRSDPAVREFHRQMSVKAQEELLDTRDEAFEKRSISGITLALDDRKLKRIKEKLKETEKAIIAIATEDQSPRSSVYH